MSIEVEWLSDDRTSNFHFVISRKRPPFCITVINLSNELFYKRKLLSTFLFLSATTSITSLLEKIDLCLLSQSLLNENKFSLVFSGRKAQKVYFCFYVICI